MSGDTPVDEQTRCRVCALPCSTSSEILNNRSSQDLTGQVIRDDAYFAYGGFSEIYHGTWTDPSTGIPNNVRRSFSFMTWYSYRLGCRQNPARHSH